MTLLKRDSNTGVFLWNFKEHLLLHNTSSGCFWRADCRGSTKFPLSVWQNRKINAWLGVENACGYVFLSRKTCCVIHLSKEMVITTAQLHSTKPELRFCAGSNPARGVSEICDCEDLWQWPRLEIRLNAFRRSTIPQKQFSSSFHNKKIPDQYKMDSTYEDFKEVCET